MLSRLGKCIRQGDWNAVAGLTERIADEKFHLTPTAVEDRLRRLQSALVAARVARAGLAVSLARTQAASRFTHARALGSHHRDSRQEFAAATDS